MKKKLLDESNATLIDEDTYLEEPTNIQTSLLFLILNLILKHTQNF